MGGNDDQREFWSGPSGQAWVDAQADMDEMLRPVADVVLAEAQLTRGMAVVDVGCGAGALSALAAEQVAQDGRVLAVDISEPLLAKTAERLGGFPQAQTLLADAAVADWPDAPFDVAISRFGVMFFDDPPAAFANIAGALRRGGRFVFAAWAPPQGQAYWQLPHKIAVARLGQPPKVEPDTPGPFGLSTADLARQRLEKGGLRDVSVTPVDVTLPLRGGPEAAADLFVKLGPARRVINAFEATPSDVAAVRASLAEALEDYRTEDRVDLPARIHLITATVA